jgi:BMFP domain-containing protein YqiC
MANLSRDQMREYQRARRARLKGLTPVPRAAPVIDAAISRAPILKAGENEPASIRAKIAAIGPGAVITKTHGRLDVLRREDFEAHAPAPPPRSMVAVGGKPGRGLIPQGRGYAAPPDIAAVSTFARAEQFRAQTETMLRALAAKSDEQERRIAALEASLANRRVDALNIVHAVAEIFRFGLTGRS